MLASSTEESEVRDPWVTRMRSLPATVVSTTLEGPLDWPNATVVSSCYRQLWLTIIQQNCVTRIGDVEENPCRELRVWPANGLVS
jgi:hypothetical protein